MPLLETIEDILKEQSVTRLEVIAQRWASSVLVFKPMQDTHTTVYGGESGEESYVEHVAIESMLIGDDFIPIDPGSAGTFKEGWLYTNSDQVSTGDRVDVVRRDGRARRYKVERLVSLGNTTSVFRKFRIVALGD